MHLLAQETVENEKSGFPGAPQCTWSAPLCAGSLDWDDRSGSAGGSEYRTDVAGADSGYSNLKKSSSSHRANIQPLIYFSIFDPP